MNTKEQELQEKQHNLITRFKVAKLEAQDKERELEDAKRNLIQSRSKMGEILAELRSLKARRRKGSPSSDGGYVNVTQARRGAFSPETVHEMFDIMLKRPFRKVS